MQQALIDLGYPIPDGATGKFAAQTSAAVVAFKTAKGLQPADPVVGPGTMRALDEDIVAVDARRPPAPVPSQAPVTPQATPSAPAPAGAAVRASDWQCVGVAQVGGAFVLGAGIFCFEFRSQRANVRAKFLFVGAGLGFGGSLGGGMAPSPSDFLNNQVPDLWTSLHCRRPFSADDLNGAYAALTTLGAAGAYGYSLTRIQAGFDDELFRDQDVSGWGTGVGVSGAAMPGIWVRIGISAYY